MDRDTALVVAFYEQVTDVAEARRRDFGVGRDDLIRIASNPAMRAEFQRLLAIADPQLQRRIITYLRDMAEQLDEIGQEADRHVELLDRAGLSVAGSITATGLGGTIVAYMSALSIVGPIAALGGGLVGVIASAFGRHALKKHSDANKLRAARLRRLTEVA